MMNRLSTTFAMTILCLHQIMLIEAQDVTQFTPTIVSACMNSSTGTPRLNVEWQFDMNAELSEIEEIIITYESDGTQQQYMYDPRDNSSEVITRGITFANNILLSGVTSNEVRVRVSTVVHRAVLIPSNEFTTVQCGVALDSSDIPAVPCPSLTDPKNGTITCSLGDDGVPSSKETCNFTCNTGYNLTGSSQKTCQSNGNWSGSPVSCTIMECPSSSLPMNSMLAESCSSTYQSMCDLQCEEHFNGSGESSHMCDVEGTSVKWRSVGGIFDCVPTLVPTATSDGGGSNGIVYAAAAGGSAVFVVLALLCTTALCLRWLYKHRKANNSDEPYYEFMQPDSQSVLHQNTRSAIKMDYNPSFEIVDNDGKPQRKITEGQYSDVKSDEAPLSLHREDTIEMETNSPYQTAIRDNNTPSHDVTNQCDYDEAYRKENASKMEIDPIYQSTAGHSRAVEIYDVANTESETNKNHDVEADQANYHEEDTAEMEIDPAYQSTVIEINDVGKETDEDLCSYVELDEDNRENTNKLEIDPAYQSTAGHNRAVEIYDVASIGSETSEDHDVGPDEVTHHGEDTVAVEIDPAYQSTAYKKQCNS